MALVWLDNNCFSFTSTLFATDSIMPVSDNDTALLCTELGSENHTYLTISGSRGTEVVRVTCQNGLIVMERAQGGTSAMTFSAGTCACFKVNQLIMDEYIQEALTGGCTPTIKVADDTADYLVVTEPADGECEWTVGLDADFISKLEECCFEDPCEPCVLADGVYENATLTIVNGKVCSVANGTNIVYTGGSCCSCGGCNATNSESGTG